MEKKPRWKFQKKFELGKSSSEQSFRDLTVILLILPTQIHPETAAQNKIVNRIFSQAQFSHPLLLLCVWKRTLPPSMTASAPTAVLPSFFGRQEVPRKPSCSCQAGVRQEASSSASSSRRKAGKRCTGEAKAYVSAWQGSAGYEAAEKKVESRKPGVSRYDSGPDIFDDDFPYSVAESRKEEGNSVVEEPTEIIFELSRRGYGWGEEIIPMVSVERRPLRTKPGLRNRSKTPTPWEVREWVQGLTRDLEK